MSNSIAELAAMRARGELTAEEFTEAKRLLQSDPPAPQPEPPKSIAMPDSIKASFEKFPYPSVPTQASKAQAKTNALGTIKGFLLFGVFLWVAFAFFRPGEKTEEPVIKNQVVDKSKSDEEKRKGFHCLSGWDGSYRPLIKVVEANLRDPSSFEHIETRITPVGPDGFHRVLMTYRAKNGFGGYNVEVANAIIRNSDCELMSNSAGN